MRNSLIVLVIAIQSLITVAPANAAHITVDPDTCRAIGGTPFRDPSRPSVWMCHLSDN